MSNPASDSGGVFSAFCREVATEPALFEQLQGLESQEVFVARVVKLAAERGRFFGPDDVRVGMQIARREWLERRIV